MPTIDDLRREIDASRRDVQGDYAALRAELDFGAKARRAVTAHPLPWLSGAALLGFVLSGRRKPRESRRRRGEPLAASRTGKSLSLLGLLLPAARLAFPFLRPALVALATRQLAAVAERFAR